MLEQGLQFAPTCGGEAEQALPFLGGVITAIDPPGFMHAANHMVA